MAQDSTPIELGYWPRPAFVPYHQRTQRWSCMVVHRRGGKTVACLMDLVDAALQCKLPEGRFAYMAPLYKQAKDVAWSYLKRFVGPIPGVQINETELRVDLPTGARVRLYGADNYDAMRGIYLDGVVLDEYGDMDPRAYPEVIRPALSDRRGWATFIGTPKGRNAFYHLMHGGAEDGIAGAKGAQASPDWFTMVLRASDSGLIAPEELADAKRSMTADQFAQEYECSFNAAIAGAYYGQELDTLESQGRIRIVAWEPTVPVHTAWDLGLNDATVVWFAQVVGNEVRLIDHLKVSNQTLIDTARDVLNRSYVYGTHYLPHDVQVRELMTAKSRRDVLESLGLRNISVGSAAPVEEGINAVKMLLPRCLFDKEKCQAGVEALRHYRSEYDEKNRTFRPRPLHDWSSHDADAFRELAVNLQPSVTAPRRKARLGMVV